LLTLQRHHREQNRGITCLVTTRTKPLWDALKDKQWHQAQQIIILSASKKTSTGLAYALANDPDAPPVVALTSSHNLPLVKQLEVYHHAITYDQLDQINTSLPTVIVVLTPQ